MDLPPSPTFPCDNLIASYKILAEAVDAFRNFEVVFEMGLSHLKRVESSFEWWLTHASVALLC